MEGEREGSGTDMADSKALCAEFVGKYITEGKKGH